MNPGVPHSASSVTLEAVKVQFAQWRAIRIKGGRIPNTLWEQVPPLIQKYGYKKVASELDVDIRWLQTKVGGLAQSAPSSSNSLDFIELPLSSLSPSFAKSPLNEQKTFSASERKRYLELTRPDGAILKASGINHQDLCLFIKNFLGL